MVTVNGEQTLHRQSILTLRLSTAGLGPLWQVAADYLMTSTCGTASDLHHKQRLHPQQPTFSKINAYL